MAEAVGQQGHRLLILLLPACFNTCACIHTHTPVSYQHPALLGCASAQPPRQPRAALSDRLLQPMQRAASKTGQAADGADLCRFVQICAVQSQAVTHLWAQLSCQGLAHLEPWHCRHVAQKEVPASNVNIHVAPCVCVGLVVVVVVGEHMASHAAGRAKGAVSLCVHWPVFFSAGMDSSS